jgi:hypothetical protein
MQGDFTDRVGSAGSRKINAFRIRINAEYAEKDRQQNGGNATFAI